MVGWEPVEDVNGQLQTDKRDTGGAQKDDPELASAIHKSGKLKSIRDFLQGSLYELYAMGQYSQAEKAKVFYLVPAKARTKAMKKYKKHLAQKNEGVGEEE